MTNSTEVRIFPKPKKVCKAVAKEILKLTRDSLQPRFNIALSGGKTPEKLFSVLVEKYRDTIPWERIHLWWGDERCVPPEDQNSNFKTTHDILISNIPIPPENIHRIKGEEAPEAEVTRYAAEITKNLNHRKNKPVFDLIILGMGEDGHTASIFPGQLQLFNEKFLCAVSEHPATSQKRITLTGRVLNNASRIFFLVTGENKAARISEIMNGEAAAKLLPPYHIHPENGLLTWYIDEAAASKIT
jgi:6-phosphogluconolactonase